MDDKTCKVCNVIKPVSFFYPNDNTCKECRKAKVRKNRAENIDYYRQFDKERAMLPHRVLARKEYDETEKGYEVRTNAKRKYINNHPNRRKANIIVGNAVRDGRLIPLPCFICGKKAEAHHPDYSRPLDVVWLCPKHHKETHALIEN